MPDQDGGQDEGGAASGDAPLGEQARGVLPATNDIIAGAWTVFAIGASSFLFATSGSLPLWLAAADFVSIAATSYFAYGRGAFSAAGKYFGDVINK